MIRPGLGDRVTVVHPATGGITDARIIEERRTWDKKGQTVKFGLDSFIHNPLERLAQKPAGLRDVKTVPSAPANVTARGRYQYNIVSWRSTASEWAIAYRRSDEATWHYTSTREAEWIHAGLQVGEEWLYRVAAIRDGVMSPWSSTVSAVVAAVPEADFDATPPGNVTWDTCDFVTDITLRWFPAARAAGYEIRNEDANWGEAAGRVWMGNATELHLTPSARSHTYYIRAISAAGVYSSASASVTVQNSVPSTPAPPSVTEFFSALWMQLQAVADDDVLGYVLYATPVDENGIATGDPQVTPYPGAWPQRITYPAVSGTRYRLEVAAYDVIGEGGKSTPVYATAQHLDDLTVPDWVTEPIENIAERYVVETDANGNLIGLVKVNDPEGVHSQIAVLVDRFSIATPDGRRQIFVFDTDDRKLYLMGDLVAEGLLRATEIQAELAKALLLQAQLATVDELDTLWLRADRISVGGERAPLAIMKPPGAYLFHFDGSLVGTQGETPTGTPVATLRPDGRFGGAVAVEVATTNLWANENGRARNMSAGGSTPPTVELVNMQTPWGTQAWKITIPANNDTGYSGCRAYTNSGPINLDGRPYSYYTYVMGDIDGIDIYPTGHYGMASLRPKPNWDVGEWRCYKKENYTSSAGIVGSNFLCFYAAQTKSYDRTFYVAIIQLEQLAFSTSHANGTRAAGKLEYEVTYGERGTLAWRMTGSSATTATDAFALGTGNTITQLSVAGAKLSWAGLDCSLDISPQDWLYCVATWDRVSGDRSLTVHNLTQCVNASAAATDADTLAFGSTLSYGGANLADVRYDEVMLWNHAATPEQIAAWHNMGAPFWDPTERIDADGRPITAAGGQVAITKAGIAVANGAMIFVSGTFSHDQLGRLITAAVDRPLTTDPGGQKSVSAPVEISAARGLEIYKKKLNVWAGTGGAGDKRYIHDGRVTDDGIIGMNAQKLIGTVPLDRLPTHLMRTAPGLSGAVMYWGYFEQVAPDAQVQVTFSSAMPYAPKVVCAHYRNGTPTIENITTTGFRIRNYSSYQIDQLFWLAMCASGESSVSTCNQCQESCQGECQNACQDGCQVIGGCQLGCETNCQTTCEGSCQDTCMFSCQLPPPLTLWE